MVVGRQRVIIENLSPQVEAGKFPGKRAATQGQPAEADILVKFAAQRAGVTADNIIDLIDDPLLAVLLSKHADRDLRSCYPEIFLLKKRLKRETDFDCLM